MPSLFIFGCKTRPEHSLIVFACLRQVWYEDFPHLKFRPKTMHSVCSQCVRHRHLIKSLNHHLAARKRQLQAYTAHLRQQYRDRLEYWASRGRSRSKGHELSLIIDSMDQAKFGFPRGPSMRSKDLSNFNRPRCHITGLILHGRAVMLSISDHDLPKSSSTMIELVASALTRLKASGVVLSELDLRIQSDNTVREMKNNPFLRYLAMMVSNGIVKSARLACLTSGHSHEDIDQLFGSLAMFLVRKCRVASTPLDFKECLELFLSKLPRPHEPDRWVIKLDAVRDWNHGSPRWSSV